jgi:colanic acid biosynthesis glycosyl transferase WcaI
MKLLILTPYFPPEVGAPQTRLYELAIRLVRRGHEVTVLTGFPNYPSGVVPETYRGRVRMDETMDGIRVVRTWIYATPNKGFYRRILNHLSFMASSAWTGLWLERHDLMLVESPPLFDGLAGVFLRLFKRMPSAFYIADLWPQSAVELGMLRNPLLVKVAEGIERFIYRFSDRLLAVTRGIEDALHAAGYRHVFFLPNAVDTGAFHPEVDGSGLRSRLGLQDRFVVLYAGTHGLQQKLETLVEAARLLESRGLPVTVLMVGDGADKDNLVRMGTGVSTLRFLDSVPRRDVPELVAACDAYAIVLRDIPLFRGARPCKMFEPMAAGKPLVASIVGEAANLIQEAEGGIVVPPEQPGPLAEAIERLYHDRDLGKRLGTSGRRYVVEHLDREHVVDRFEELARDLLPPAVAAASPGAVGP